LSADNLQALTSTQIQGISAAQMPGLNISVILALSDPQGGVWKGSEIGALTTAQIESLSGEMQGWSATIDPAH